MLKTKNKRDFWVKNQRIKDSLATEVSEFVSSKVYDRSSTEHPLGPKFPNEDTPRTEARESLGEHVVLNYNKDLTRAEKQNTNEALSEKILAEILAYRRLPKHSEICENSHCEKCSSLHSPKILSSVEKGEPVTFVLPAFPGKSPNPNKILGPLPDFAEKLSLKFLAKLCKKIKSFYNPGIKIIICSDGRVFSDVVGMKESDVTAYQDDLDRLIKEMSLPDISTFNLDEVYSGKNFDEMRTELMATFAYTLESLQEKVRNGSKDDANTEELEANRMYCGITRFLLEDSMTPGQQESKTALQKDAKTRAYEVIRRSNAWSKLIERIYPEAVRLSIHPQPCGAKKIGIRLVGKESWMTPWHGVAVQTIKGYALLKRSQAEAMGADLVYCSQGRPSHYSLLAKKLSPMGGNIDEL